MPNRFNNTLSLRPSLDSIGAHEQLKFTLIVCGRFHYHHYLRYVGAELERAYFSHKISETLGISFEKRKNLCLKEYLVGLHLKLLGRVFFDSLITAYQTLWSIELLLRIESSRLTLVMLHGNCTQTIRWLKKEGGVVVGEAVNMHPVSLNLILNRESARLNLRNPMEKFVGRKVEEISLVDYLICPSEGVRQSYVDHGFPVENTFVIPYGVPDKRDRIKITRTVKANLDSIREISVICVGQISVRKGQILLIDALELLVHKGWKVSLTLVGAADPDYLRCVTNTGAEFIHHKHLTHQRVKEEISRHDVLALLSIEDGFGMVVTEAIEVNTPVVVSKYAGASEVVKNIGGGVVVDPFDKESVADALLTCLRGNHPALNSEPDSWADYASKLKLTLSGIISNVQDKRVSQH